MTPHQKLALIKEKLKALGQKDDAIRYYSEILESYPDFLKLDYGTDEFIAYVMNPKAHNNIKGAIEFTAWAISLDYPQKIVAKLGAGPSGRERLGFVCHYTEYLMSLGFSKHDIIDIISKTSTSIFQLVIPNFDKLTKQLGLPLEGIIPVMKQTKGIRVINTILINFDKLKGNTSEEIFEYTKSKASRPPGLDLIEPNTMTTAEEAALADAAAALLDDFNKRWNAVPAQHSGETTTNVSNNNAASTANVIVVGTISSQSTNLILQNAFEQSQKKDQSTWLEEAKLALASELEKYMRRDQAQKKVGMMAPYLVELTKLSISIPDIAKIARMKNPVPATKDLIAHLPTTLKLGHDLGDILHKITSEENTISLGEFNELHKIIQKAFGFSDQAIVEIAKHPRGQANLISLRKHHDTLVNKLSIPIGDIQDIVNRSNGDTNLKALATYYNHFIILGFPHNQIIQIAKNGNAQSYFNVLLACYTDIMKHAVMTHEQLLKLTFGNEGIPKLCWIYFYLTENAPVVTDPAVLKNNLLNDFKKMASVNVLPLDYPKKIQIKAEQRYKELASQNPTHKVVTADTDAPRWKKMAHRLPSAPSVTKTASEKPFNINQALGQFFSDKQKQDAFVSTSADKKRKDAPVAPVAPVYTSTNGAKRVVQENLETSLVSQLQAEFQRSAELEEERKKLAELEKALETLPSPTYSFYNCEENVEPAKTSYAESTVELTEIAPDATTGKQSNNSSNFLSYPENDNIDEIMAYLVKEEEERNKALGF